MTPHEQAEDKIKLGETTKSFLRAEQKASRIKLSVTQNEPTLRVPSLPPLKNHGNPSPKFFSKDLKVNKYGSPSSTF